MGQISFQIDVRFLVKDRQEFEEDWRAKLLAWADSAYDCFRFKEKLIYIPRIYVTPFYVFAESPTVLNFAGKTRSVKLRINEVAMISVDADRPEERWAMYVLCNLIKKATEEVNTASIAHELLHFYRRPGKPSSITLKELTSMVGKSEVEKYYMKEKEVDQAEDFFEEPVKSMILKMEKEKSQLGSGKKYTEGAEQVKSSDCLNRILGASRAQEFMSSLLP